MSDSFYRDFEDLFRGSRDLIKSRLQVYLPFVRHLASPDARPKALDLGCGRGEWLEVLGENGFDASGVDLDEAMLAACHDRGLKVRQGDLLKTLPGLPSESLALISAFHVVEHLKFDEVRVLVREALRILKPGGLLILETPNPENLSVGATSFYMDPSHLRPLPSGLLDFVLAHGGFARTKVLYLQESADLHGCTAVRLIDVLNGVSPDYAVVGQKRPAPDTPLGQDEPFHAEYGLSLGALAQRYDTHLTAQMDDRLERSERRTAQVEHRLGLSEIQTAHVEDRLGQSETRTAQVEDRLGRSENHTAQVEDRLGQSEGRTAQMEDRLGQSESRTAQVEDRLGQSENRTAQVEDRLGQSENRTAQVEARLGQAEIRAAQVDDRLARTEARIEQVASQSESRNAQFEERLVRAEVRIEQTERQLRDMLTSRSWRVTAPLRWMACQARALRPNQLKAQAKPLLLVAARFIMARGWLWSAVNALLARYPSLRMRLRRVIHETTVVAPAPQVSAPPVAELSPLSPRARRIYADLKAQAQQSPKESC